MLKYNPCKIERTGIPQCRRLTLITKPSGGKEAFHTDSLYIGFDAESMQRSEAALNEADDSAVGAENCESARGAGPDVPHRSLSDEDPGTAMIQIPSGYLRRCSVFTSVRSNPFR